MTSLVLLALMLWLPGALLHRAFGVARGCWGTGLPAVEATLSLGFLSIVLLPVYLAGAPVKLAPLAVLLATVVLLVAAFVRRRAQASARGRAVSSDTAANAPSSDTAANAISSDTAANAAFSGATRMEAVMFAAAVALLLPATLAYSGANVDDWWDLSFVSGWLADGCFGFAQMALSPNPEPGGSAFHPRFLWSVWLMLQTLVAFVSGEQPWRMQAGAFAAVSSVLVVSAQAALARALFRERSNAPQLAAATVAMTAAWVWGTDALPLFVRGYQDKLFAGFVLAPVLLALAIDSSRTNGDARRIESGADSACTTAAARARHRATAAVALAAIAVVSVHSLIFTMAAFACVLAWAARHRTGTMAWLRCNPGMAAALLVAALYPLAQAVVLAGIFGDQGISLAMRDNPVVRAHLSLNRLLGDVSPAWIVHPRAVFGPVALPAVVALVFAWRRRRDDSARMLLALSIVPALLLFIPGLAALAGTLWVPWMLYRLGWLIPVAPLLAFALVSLASGPRWKPAAAVFAAAVVLLAGSTAADRLRRDMHEHPGPPPAAPTAAAAAIYDYLAARPGRAAVLAPPNFSGLVPALAGKPVVAFSERGTLVFSLDETAAYERLRDRGTFFASSSTASARDAVARRYGAGWAVLPRTLVASGSEASWIGQFGPEALLAAQAADRRTGEPCSDAQCQRWWSATPASAAAGLSGAWSLVLQTRDYFLFERGHVSNGDVATPGNAAPRTTAGTEAGTTAGTTAGRAAGTEAGTIARSEDAPAAGEDQARTATGMPRTPRTPRWLRPFALTESEPPATRGDVLATATGAPGAVVTYDIPPRFVLPSVAPIWLDGPAPWEDAPAEVNVVLDIGVACAISAVELVPHLPRERREVLEVRVDGSTVRTAAHHGAPIHVPVPGASRRSTITVHVRSLVGSPVSLADIRVLGDRSTCDAGWPSQPAARTPQLAAPAQALLALAASLPDSGRPFVSLARSAARARGESAPVALLVEATTRQPSLVEAWVELGFARDALAASATTKEDAAAASAAARDAFHSAVVADSHSAWAQGCAAWAERRAGHALPAIRHALAAAQLDPLYGDAWTIIGYVLADLRLYAPAERAMQFAERGDPDRNWPVLARADVALARRDAKAGDAIEAARAALRAWIARHPFDLAAREKLSKIAASARAGSDGHPQ